MLFQSEISTPYSYASFVNSMADADKEVWLNDTRADFAFRKGKEIGEHIEQVRFAYLEGLIEQKDKEIKELKAQLEEKTADLNSYLERKINDDLDIYYGRRSY